MKLLWEVLFELSNFRLIITRDDNVININKVNALARRGMVVEDKWLASHLVQIFERAQFFSMKLLWKVLFDLLNSKLIITRDDIVININNKVNALARRGMVVEDRVISLTPGHAKLN